jgi:hypothetical protein
MLRDEILEGAIFFRISEAGALLKKILTFLTYA